MIRALFWIGLPIAALIIATTHARRFNGPPFVIGLVIIALIILLVLDGGGDRRR